MLTLRDSCASGPPTMRRAVRPPDARTALHARGTQQTWIPLVAATTIAVLRPQAHRTCLQLKLPTVPGIG